MATGWTTAQGWIWDRASLIIALLNTGDGSGLEDGPADCVGLRNGPSNNIFVSDGAELIKGPNADTGNRINNNTGLNQRPVVGTGNGSDLP